MHRVAYVVVGLEALAIGIYVVSVRVADSCLPERGGSGDATSIHLWNGRAALAFWLLVALWLVALGRVALRAPNQRKCRRSGADAAARGGCAGRSFSDSRAVDRLRWSFGARLR